MTSARRTLLEEYPQLAQELVDPADALRSPGSHFKAAWKCFQPSCGTVWEARISGRTGDAKGCPDCGNRSRAFAGAVAGTVYFLEHAEAGLIKVGITADGRRRDRIALFEAHGWARLEEVRFDSLVEAKAVESRLLSALADIGASQPVAYPDSLAISAHLKGFSEMFFDTLEARDAVVSLLAALEKVCL
jgi:hypothetical protein